MTHSLHPIRIFYTLCLLALVNAAQAQNQVATQTGEQVYKQTCVACHASGTANAPKFGDSKAWKPLIAEGQQVLTAHAWVGVRGMPPKGGRSDLSLEDFSKAVAYMARAAGGQWQDPDSKMMEKIRKEEQLRISQLNKKK